MKRPPVVWGLVLFTLSSGTLRASQPDGIVLSVLSGMQPQQVNLQWTGGQPDFTVFRSTNKALIVDPANAIGTTSERTWVDSPPTGEALYYEVTSPCVYAPPEVCDGLDNDCDGTVDEAGSETSCSLPNASPRCTNGICEIDQCNSGHDDCDANPANGCETDLNTAADCGACGVTCNDGNSCTTDSCQGASCRHVDVNACATPVCALGACGADTDGDGLSNAWELNGGIDLDCNGIVASAEGDLVFHEPPDAAAPDVYLEIDYMVAGHTHAPLPGMVQTVVDAFAARGVTLHVDPVHDAIPERRVVTFNPVNPLCNGPDATTFSALKSQYKDPRRDIAYHYVVFGHFSECDLPQHCLACPSGPFGRPQYGQGGQAEFLGNDGIVTFGAFDQVGRPLRMRYQAGTLMHELGHLLGLGHGGSDTTVQKPHYFSVMNYSYQFRGIEQSAAPGPYPTSATDPAVSWRIDYSGEALESLDENSLDESLGILGASPASADIAVFFAPDGSQRFAPANGSPIDWDDNGSHADFTFADITGDLQYDYLVGYDDWSSLYFGFQCVGAPSIVRGELGFNTMLSRDTCEYDPPEACNGIDDDCDDVIPAGEADADADGVRTCAGDCDDGDPRRFPGNPEVCDGVDNDCDSAVDEAGSEASCAPGQVCVGGVCICPGTTCDAQATGGCVNLLTDPQHCGACSTDCGDYLISVVACTDDLGCGSCVNDGDCSTVGSGKCVDGTCGLCRGNSAGTGPSCGAFCASDAECGGSKCTNGFCCPQGSECVGGASGTCFPLVCHRLVDRGTCANGTCLNRPACSAPSVADLEGASQKGVCSIDFEHTNGDQCAAYVTNYRTDLPPDAACGGSCGSDMNCAAGDRCANGFCCAEGKACFGGICRPAGVQRIASGGAVTYFAASPPDSSRLHGIGVLRSGTDVFGSFVNDGTGTPGMAYASGGAYRNLRVSGATSGAGANPFEAPAFDKGPVGPAVDTAVSTGGAWQVYYGNFVSGSCQDAEICRLTSSTAVPLAWCNQPCVEAAPQDGFCTPDPMCVDAPERITAIEFAQILVSPPDVSRRFLIVAHGTTLSFLDLDGGLPAQRDLDLTNHNLYDPTTSAAIARGESTPAAILNIAAVPFGDVVIEVRGTGVTPNRFLLNIDTHDYTARNERVVQRLALGILPCAGSCPGGFACVDGGCHKLCGSCPLATTCTIVGNGTCEVPGTGTASVCCPDGAVPNNFGMSDGRLSVTPDGNLLRFVPSADNMPAADWRSFLINP